MHIHKHRLQPMKFKIRSQLCPLLSTSSVTPPLFLSFSHLPSLLPLLSSYPFIWKEYILWNNWKWPSFCSCLNNAIAGFIGDHYSNCFIIASTLALAAAHSLSTSRPCHTLCVPQQRVTLDQEPGGSLSLSLWPTWQHYNIPLLERKKYFPFSLPVFLISWHGLFLSHFLFLPISLTWFLINYFINFSLTCLVSVLCWWIRNVST